ncbi:MAG: ABC transporter ATP-binding protein [Eubacteriales bacterium]
MKHETKLKNTLIKELYRNNIPYIILCVFVAILNSVITLATALVLQEIFNCISGDATSFDYSSLLCLTLILLALMIFAYVISIYATPRIRATGMSNYKQYIFGALSKKSISAFSGESTSLYISSLTNDIATVERAYLVNIYDLISNILLFTASLVMMIYYSPLLTLVAILFSFLPIVASILFGDKVAKAEKELSEENASYTASLKDSLLGFSVIKSFKAEKQICELFANQVKKIAKAQTKRDRNSLIVGMLANVAGFIAQFGVFFFAAYLALSGGNITAGTVILFTQMMNYIIGPINVIPGCLADLKASNALVDKIANALCANTENEVERSEISFEKGIELHDLCFSYNGEKQALDNINYTFEKGKKYAIVGASGSGKSTLLSLLMASYKNYSGSICYDGAELRTLNTSDLYDMQSIIAQNVFVFNSSIKDNITMFKDFPEDELERAISLSGLSALTGEKGSDYLCGEGGNALSGGEKQRISIARSLLSRSKVLLVDEATAALDSETSFAVTSSILSLDGITVIEVTHSLDGALLKKYDGILTLKGGSIIEQGTFDELIEKKGYFYSLYTISQ